jgi:hypothetical protein
MPCDTLNFVGSLLGGAIGGGLGAWATFCYVRKLEKWRARNAIESSIHSIRDEFARSDWNSHAVEVHGNSITALREPVYLFLPMQNRAEQKQTHEAWRNYFALREKQWADDTIKAVLSGADELYPSNAKPEMLAALDALEQSLG